MAQIPTLPSLPSLGQGSLSNLRRSWVVIVGDGAPAPEVANANAVAAHIMRKLNLTSFKAFPSSFPGLAYLVKNANVITIGGPVANQYALLLNDVIEPKYDITVNRAMNSGETFSDYVKAGGITVNGYLVNKVAIALQAHRGIIGSGKQAASRLRPLQVVNVSGTMFEDTCTMVAAYLADTAPGYFNCGWPDPADPTYAACPASPTYTPITS